MSNTVVPFFHLSIFAHLLNVFVQDTHTQFWFKTFYYNKRTRLRQSYTYSHITDSWNCIHKTFIVLNLVKYVCACLLFIHENENICEYEWRVYVCVCMKNEKRIQLQSYTSFSLRSHSSYVQLVSSVLSSEPSKAHEILLLRVYEVFVCAFLNIYLTTCTRTTTGHTNSKIFNSVI